MRSEEFLEREGQSETITVIFKNAPSKQAPKLLLEHFGQLDESKTKEWGKGYKYKLDRRPNYMGGDQLHIWGPKGRAWAYRYNGVRSEANLPSRSRVLASGEPVSQCGRERDFQRNRHWNGSAPLSMASCGYESPRPDQCQLDADKHSTGRRRRVHGRRQQ